jgi:GAF domain-containing protein
MNFYSGVIAKPDDDLLAIVEDIGDQLGRFIERKRAERALQAARLSKPAA